MRLKTLGIIASILFPLNLAGQQNILDRPDIPEKVEACLYSTYGFKFEKAKQLQLELQNELPRHPVPYFLKALIIYWENFPLLPDQPELKQFESVMEKTIKLSNELMDQPRGRMEGIFFDMHARAFRGMYWADNGKPAKVLSDLDNMYRTTMEGIDYKEEFSDFYFSSGLYNYYIVAYAEKRPFYKPVFLLFREGNKEKGLQELQIAIDESTYIKYEAILFMSLLQLNYEMNIEAALDYISILYNNFPDNIYFTSQYLIILVHNENYVVASAINSKLKDAEKPFDRMIYMLIEAFLDENYRKNTREAVKKYRSVIEMNEDFGAIADLYAAIAHAGLARIEERKGNSREARSHRRTVEHLSVYDFILEFGRDGNK